MLAGHGGEPDEHVGRRAPGWNSAALVYWLDVLGRLEHAERAGALGVRLALRHLLAVEVRHLLEEVHVVQQQRTVGCRRVSELRSLGAGAPQPVVEPVACRSVIGSSIGA